jgi:hypothetical protein
LVERSGSQGNRIVQIVDWHYSTALERKLEDSVRS